MTILSTLMELIDKHGAVTAVIASLLLVNLFFVWRDFRREDRQQKQIDALTSQIQSLILPVVIECREAIAASKEVILASSEVIKQNSEIIGSMKHD